MNISLVYDKAKEYNLETINDIKNIFLESGFSIDEDNPDVIVILGGDGTFLKAIHLFLDNRNLDNLLFVGLGLGELNFFYDYSYEDIDLLIRDLNNHKCKKVSYSLLECLAFKGEEQIEDILALNEIRIANPFKLLECEISLDDVFLEEYKGSGLCIATPLGSSGYNRSVGGALLDHSLYAMELTEIAPLNNKYSKTLHSPLVIDGDKTISINLDKQVSLAYDSSRIKLDADRIEVFLSEHKVTLLRSPSFNYVKKISKDLIGNDD